MPFDAVALAASISESNDSAKHTGGPNVGVGKQGVAPGQAVVWVGADIPGTNLHVTLVPPPANRSASGGDDPQRERREVLKRLRLRNEVEYSRLQAASRVLKKVGCSS